MISIRPIWEVNVDFTVDQGSVHTLLQHERHVVAYANSCFEFAAQLLGQDNVVGLEFLLRSARHDFVAASEMARAGYLKQAYSLWRSWFEQSIFMLYFLEAPVHRIAWKVAAEVTQDDSPPYKLMLHQLLSDSGEKHPFALVVNDRFGKLLDVYKISSFPKNKRPIARAAKILTMFSQGVHGTYQPHAATDIESLNIQIQRHCLPVLKEASSLLHTLWVLLITNLIDLSPETLVLMRQGMLSPDQLNDAGLADIPLIATLAPLFAEAFPNYG